MLPSPLPPRARRLATWTKDVATLVSLCGSNCSVVVLRQVVKVNNLEERQARRHQDKYLGGETMWWPKAIITTV